MNLSELSVNRPVLAIVLNILLVLFGAIGFYFLPIREYPNIDPPVITVTTSFSGANPLIVESQVTVPLEKYINGCPGLRSMTGVSALGTSKIVAEFNVGYNLETAANDVRDKVSQAVGFLPTNLDGPPTVSKTDANTDYVVAVGIFAPNKTLVQLSDYAERYLQSIFETIPQVSEVDILGERKPAMRLWLDPNKMNTYGISYVDIYNRMKQENIELPNGKMYGNTVEPLLIPNGYLVNPQQFNNVIIREDSSGIVRFKDVGRAEIGPENYEQYLSVNGQRTIGLGIQPLAGANVINIANEFYKRLEIVKETQPNYKFFTIFDNTTTIREGIKEVEETLIISFIIVIIVIYFFFRNWLSALRPLIDIPVSLIASFFIMYILGFTINLLTMLAIVLATGLVVDDGIVVTENIFRKIEKGLPPRQAAIEGSKEIFFAVISTSITLAIVFLPIVFLQGFIGSLFKEFGIVVAVAVLLSAFVSLTLTPVLNVYMSSASNHSKFYLSTEKFFVGMETGYKKMIYWFFKHIRWTAFVMIAICIAMIVFFLSNLRSEVAPIEDKSRLRFVANAPEGTSYELSHNYMTGFYNYLLDSVPERINTFMSHPAYSSGPPNDVVWGSFRLDLFPINNRNRSETKIAIDIMKDVAPRFKNLTIVPTIEQTISVGSAVTALPCRIIIENFDVNKLKAIIPAFTDSCMNSKEFSGVSTNLLFTQPYQTYTIDRTKAADLGLSLQDVEFAINQAFGNVFNGYFYPKGFQYRIVPQFDYNNRQTPTDISKMYVKNKYGENIPISQIIQFKTVGDAPALYDFNRVPMGIVSAALSKGYYLGDGIARMKYLANKMLDKSFQTNWWGASRDYQDSSSSLQFAFILAIILIYLVLAAQFESFITPFVILTTVPLALAGALLSLWLFNQTLNIFSEIGIIMLIGLVTKNGILLVEFANQLQETGLSKIDAMATSASHRLRPILMTSIAMAGGALPIALSLGAASTSRVSLGIVIVGGIMFSLILTLFIVPSIYIYFTKQITPKHKVIGD